MSIEEMVIVTHPLSGSSTCHVPGQDDMLVRVLGT